jgi:hypothetical protein
MKANRVSWNPQEGMNFVAASEDRNLYSFDMRKMDSATCVHMGHAGPVYVLIALHSSPFNPHSSPFNPHSIQSCSSYCEWRDENSFSMETMTMGFWILRFVSKPNVQTGCGF